MRFSQARLERALETAPPEAWNQGLDWYEEANRWCRRVGSAHDLPATRVAGILAALSPNQGWDANVRETLRLIEERRAAQFPANVSRALRILDGEAPLDVLGGKKVRSFYRNIAYLDDYHVTVDRHAASILTGIPSARFADVHKHALERAGAYERAADKYRQVAESLGLRPYQVQAVAWVARRAG